MPEGYVRFDHVSKKFQRGELHDSLRDLIPAVTRRLLRRTPPKDQLRDNEFWAVRDISFSVQPGEALGIIGPNGAGKSTILKLLTRILRPDSGHSEVRGRIGSLIEVAAGFHPDLTGRENVFLQGAIMGMKRAEITRRFDEIVGFAELADFIDTPVKRYSSGMNARLGFAIAVHLDPEVLIVDEVLAVGDYSFQKKAFGRIREMARRDIPVVIVSHQLEKIAELCSRVLLLNRGQVVREGTAEECVSEYLMGGLAPRNADAAAHPIRIERVKIDSDLPVRSGEWLRVSIDGTVRSPRPAAQMLSVRVRSLQNSKAIFAIGFDEERPLPERGAFHLEMDLQANTGSGLYAVETMIWDRVERREVCQGPHAVFQIAEDPGFFGSVNLQPRIRIRGTPPEDGAAAFVQRAPSNGRTTAYEARSGAKE